jgi:DNA-binding NarL/FixJ family response regulator
MPGWNGLEILKRLKEEKIPTPVLILSVQQESQYAIRALKAGASGYLTKLTASAKLVEAIRAVYGGRKYISQSLAEKLVDSITGEREKPPHEYLSDRELQVLCMVASGKSVSDISSELFLSVKTISTYRRRILEKMNMGNNNELIAYAINNKLLDQ